MIKNEEVKFYDILNKVANWKKTENEEVKFEAKLALQKLLCELSVSKPHRNYQETGYPHLGYLHYLLIIRQTLIDKQYQISCHELQSLMYRWPLLQINIYNNVQKLLEEYIKE